MPFTMTNISRSLSSHCYCIWEQFPAWSQFQQRHAGGPRLCFGHYPVRKDRSETRAGQRGPGHPEPHPHHPHRAHRGLLPEDSAASQVLPSAGWSHGQKWVYAGRAASSLKLWLELWDYRGRQVHWSEQAACIQSRGSVSLAVLYPAGSVALSCALSPKQLMSSVNWILWMY